jgi:hypothetical protein
MAQYVICRSNGRLLATQTTEIGSTKQVCPSGRPKLPLTDLFKTVGWLNNSGSSSVYKSVSPSNGVVKVSKVEESKSLCLMGFGQAKNEG